eukprot:TRINITY_DN4170_c0_g1_i1.p1 TRINITY_DN4170_c0_g1~~TRINITY_DN4170_c0_g1_i1.p1  ORF type:complete len:237 (-),score=52.61 TRINITY_DN4170_c0_g1_i1:480-1190(-)
MAMSFMSSVSKKPLSNTFLKPCSVRLHTTKAIHASSSTARPRPSAGEQLFQQGNSKKLYASYAIYKGKAVLRMNPKEPEFTRLDSGAFRLSREGSVFLEFAPAVGVRQYDWSRKQIFALSVAELGQLLALAPEDMCEFYHDPFMGNSGAGKVKKILKVGSLQGREAYSFNLSVSDKTRNIEENFFVPVEKSEFAVMRSSFNFLLPYLMGWHAFVDPAKLSEPSTAESGSTLSEWGM